MKKELAVGLASLCMLACNGDYNANNEQTTEVQQEVINGEPAEHSESPSVAALTRGPDGTVPHCTMTMIEPDLGVTAGHCVKESYNPENFWVVYGSKDVNKIDPDCRFKVKDFKAHEEYDSGFYDELARILSSLNYIHPDGGVPENPDVNLNDIGIVLLEEPIPNVYTEEIYCGEFTIGEITRITGYGRDSNYDGGQLNKGDGPIVLDFEKEFVFGANYPNGNDGSPGDNPDGCYGDSGGPVYMLKKNRTVEVVDIEAVAGAVSRIPEGAAQVTCGYGTAITKICPYSEDGWIAKTAEELRNPTDDSSGGSGGSGGFGTAGNGGFGGDGICNPGANGNHEEKPVYLSGENNGNCSYSSGNEGSIPWGLLTLLAVSAIRRRKD